MKTAFVQSPRVGIKWGLMLQGERQLSVHRNSVLSVWGEYIDKHLYFIFFWVFQIKFRMFQTCSLQKCVAFLKCSEENRSLCFMNIFLNVIFYPLLKNWKQNQKTTNFLLLWKQHTFVCAHCLRVSLPCPRSMCLARVPTVSGRICHMEVTLSRSINSSFFLSREGKELVRVMEGEASSHPWHWLVPGLQHAETCHASSSGTVNLQAHKSPPSTVQTCASQFFISAFTQGFGCLSGVENRYFRKGVLGETAAGPRQRDLLLRWGEPGGTHAVGQGMQGVWWAAPSNPPTAAESSVKAQAQCRYSDKTTHSAPSLWQGLPCTDNQRWKD